MKTKNTWRYAILVSCLVAGLGFGAGKTTTEVGKVRVAGGEIMAQVVEDGRRVYVDLFVIDEHGVDSVLLRVGDSELAEIQAVIEDARAQLAR